MQDTAQEDEALIQLTAKAITDQQWEAAEALAEKVAVFSTHELAAEICILMATEFKRGIDLTMEHYGIGRVRS